MKANITRAELFKPIPCNCGVCGNKEAVIYPAPGVHGTCYCPSCSPAWLKSFAEHCTKQLVEGATT